jgi:predicted GH43/DUF377 family glycosyl hydrolase
MVAYVVEALDKVVIDGSVRLSGMDLMSPYIWAEDGGYRVMVRVVPNPLGPHDPTGVIWCGECVGDGLTFAMHDRPAIEPGPDPIDAGGCEDPTVITGPAGYRVYYTGVDAARRQGSLLVAEGPDLRALAKRAVMLKAPPGEGNIKEATLAQATDGSWRLFYEYAADNASRVGMATAPASDGPWTVVDDPFPIRADSWDNWHLSTGPIVEMPGRDPVMFYNGATQDARWRIGWVSFAPDYSAVTGRGLEPLILPPPAGERTATDIAFAASAVVEDAKIHLYYSLEDRLLARATVAVYG